MLYKQNGGAIKLGGYDAPGIATLEFLTLLSNIAGTTGSPSGRGGAISVDSSGVTGSVSLSNSLIINNAAA